MMVNELMKFTQSAQSAIYVVVVCLLMAGLVVIAVALAQASRWLESSIPKLKKNRRRRKKERLGMKRFKEQLDRPPFWVFEKRPAGTKKPFDQDGE